MQVLEPGKGEGGELKVVGGEEGVAPPLVQGLGEGGGDGHPVQAARAPAHLVQEDEATFGGLLEHQGHLLHLHHEGALPPGEVVRGPDPRVDPVKEGKLRLLGGHEAPDLGEEGDEGGLAEEGGLPRHVGPGDEDELVGHLQVVGDEGGAALHHRVAPRPDPKPFPEAGPGVAVAHRHLGEGGVDVKLGEDPRRLP